MKSKYPKASATMHGKFGTTEKNKKVEIHFCKGGKCYFYYGSYQDVLSKVGINVVYSNEIETAKNKLAEYKEKHGKTFDDFGFDVTYDYTAEIERLESYLIKVKDYILI